MSTRKQKVEELLADLHSLKRTMVFRMPGSAKMPRVTPSQWGVLMLIEQRGQSTVKNVAEALGITSSASTQLVDGLVASGYLVREISAEDRRIVMLTLPKKSKNQVNNMRKHVLEKILKIFEIFNDAEFDRYYALNKKLIQGSLIQERSAE